MAVMAIPASWDGGHHGCPCPLVVAITGVLSLLSPRGSGHHGCPHPCYPLVVAITAVPVPTVPKWWPWPSWLSLSPLSLAGGHGQWGPCPQQEEQTHPDMGRWPCPHCPQGLVTVMAVPIIPGCWPWLSLMSSSPVSPSGGHHTCPHPHHPQVVAMAITVVPSVPGQWQWPPRLSPSLPSPGGGSGCHGCPCPQHPWVVAIMAVPVPIIPGWWQWLLELSCHPWVVAVAVTAVPCGHRFGTQWREVTSAAPRAVAGTMSGSSRMLA